MKDAYWMAVNYGVVDESRRMGVTMQLVEAGGYVNLNKQISQIEDCVESGSDAVVIGVNFEDIGVEQLESFVDSYLISYPILRSEPLPATPLGEIPGLPTTFIIAPDGSPVARQVGPITGKQLDDYIARKKEASPG